MSIKFKNLNKTIIKCKKCSRLNKFIKKIAKEKRPQNIHRRSQSYTQWRHWSLDNTSECWDIIWKAKYISVHGKYKRDAIATFASTLSQSGGSWSVCCLSRLGKKKNKCRRAYFITTKPQALPQAQKSLFWGTWKTEGNWPHAAELRKSRNPQL